jgi:hypothetical protein
MYLMIALIHRREASLANVSDYDIRPGIVVVHVLAWS